MAPPRQRVEVGGWRMEKETDDDNIQEAGR
jgi:hypothetical protein